MKIFIIILHFGDSEITDLCLKSILKNDNSYKEIIVIDNASGFKSKIPDLRTKKVKIITNKKNLGYGGGMNVGIKYALPKNADYALLLNNDVVFEEKILSKLVKFLETKKDIGIVGPAIKFKRDGKLIYDLGGKVNMLFGRTRHKEVEKVEDKTFYSVDYISGCCMLIKKEVFSKIRYFDELFFLYYEDVDFCLRAKNAGFYTFTLPNVSVFHELSKSSGQDSSFAVYHQIKSALLFGKKYIRHRVLNISFVFIQCCIFLLKKPKTGINAFHSLIKNYK